MELVNLEPKAFTGTGGPARVMRPRKGVKRGMKGEQGHACLGLCEDREDEVGAPARVVIAGGCPSLLDGLSLGGAFP